MLPSVLEGRRRWIFLRLIANGLAQAALAACVALLLDRLLSSPPTAGRSPDVTGLGLLTAAGFALVLLRAWQRRDCEAMGLTYVHDIRVKVFAHMLRVPQSVRAPGLGSMLTRLTNDLLGIKNWISYGVSGTATAATASTALLVLMLAADWRLAVASVTAMALIAIAIWALLGPLDRAVRDARRQRGRMAGNLGEKLTARLTLRMLGRGPSETKTVETQSAELTRLLTRRGLLSGLMRYMPEASLPLAVAGFVLAGYFLPVAGPPAGGAQPGLVAWIFMLGLLMSQLQEVARATDYWVSFGPAIDRISSILALPAPEPGTRPLPAESAGGTILHIEALEAEAGGPRLDLELRHSESAFLSGASREAMSRLLRAVVGLDPVTSGSVRLRGIDIQDVAPADLQRAIGYASPDLPLIRGTIGGNLRKGARGAATDDWVASVVAACGLASGRTQIAMLLEREVIDQGRGQPAVFLARVRLARALCRQPILLVVDEEELAEDRSTRLPVLALAKRNGIAVVWRRSGTQHGQSGDRVAVQGLQDMAREPNLTGGIGVTFPDWGANAKA